MRIQRVLGIVLILGGGALLGVFQLGLSGVFAPALVGAFLLVAFVAQRTYGFLISGGVLMGLGIGLMVGSVQNTVGAVPIGVGAGFVFVALLDRLAVGRRPGGWWPLVPGGVLLLIGGAQYAQSRQALEAVAQWWPSLLIAVGVWALLRERRLRIERRQHRHQPDREPTPH